MTQGIGYSHSTFSSGYLRRYAQEVDKKENGGNNNGIIDGSEISAFTKLVEQKTGYKFDFSNMKQVTKKTIDVQDNNGNFLYNTLTEIGNKYKTASVKSTEWLNNKRSGHDLLVPSRKTLDIAYMNDQDYESTKKAIDEQEKKVANIIQKQNDKIAAEKAKERQEQSKSTLEKGFDWLINLIN